MEMLAGKPVYAGETPAETLAAVIMTDSSQAIGTLPANTPPAIRNLIGRCLTKDPRQRLRDIGEARIVIENVASDKDPAVAQPITSKVRRRQRLIEAVAASMTCCWLSCWLSHSCCVHRNPSSRLDQSA